MGSSTATDPRTIAVRSLIAMAKGDRSEFDALVHPQYVDHESAVQPPASRVGGPEGMQATALWLRAAFAEMRYDIHQTLVDGDLVAVRSTWNGRHIAPFVTYTPGGHVDTAFPPTGRTFAVDQSHFFRLADGKIAEHWANRDDLGHARQLGWVPPSPLYLLRMALAKRKAVVAKG
jgi:predicted ester cyclase